MSDSIQMTAERNEQNPRVQLSIDDRVARIMLNNPPLNMLTLDMLTAIAAAVNEAARHEAICAIVFEPAR